MLTEISRERRSVESNVQLTVTSRLEMSCKRQNSNRESHTGSNACQRLDSLTHYRSRKVQNCILSSGYTPTPAFPVFLLIMVKVENVPFVRLVHLKGKNHGQGRRSLECWALQLTFHSIDPRRPRHLESYCNHQLYCTTVIVREGVR